MIVAAAGNEGRDLADAPGLPRVEHEPRDDLGRRDRSRAASLATWSNFGRTGVDIAAPGTDLLTTLPNGSYAAFSGTSAAAPSSPGPSP